MLPEARPRVQRGSAHDREREEVARLLHAPLRPLPVRSRAHRRVPALRVRFAQSFANTIPFSESIGFIAKVNPKDENDVDYPFYVTAHEVAHQWWANQVVGRQGRRGQPARRDAGAVLAGADGDEARLRRRADGKRFLKYELDQLPAWARLRARKRRRRSITSRRMSYVYYNKGTLAMYALQDYLGEDVVNDVRSAKLIEEHTLRRRAASARDRPGWRRSARRRRRSFARSSAICSRGSCSIRTARWRRRHRKRRRQPPRTCTSR